MEVKEQIEALGKEINTKLEKACEQAKNAASEEAKKVAGDLKTEVGNMVTKWQDLQKLQQDQLDANSTELKKLRTQGGGGQNQKSFSDVVAEGLEKSEQRKSFKENKKGFVIDLNEKAVGNFSSSNLTGSYFIPAQSVPGVLLKPYEEQHVRDILTVGQTTSDTIRYVVDNGGEGAFTTVAAGALKPQIDRDLEIKDATVKKIAAYSRVPEEMIDDIPYLTSFITQFMTEELMLVEDAQLLYGDNTGTNLNGINPQATAFAAGTLIVASPNNYDVIVAAKLQIRLQKLAVPTAIVVNPTDFTKLKLTKDANGQYLFPELKAGQGTIDGTPVIQSTSVTVGSFIVGDFRRGAAMWDRMQKNVRFYDQDQDNAIRNLVTIVMEERIALAVYRPLAFVKGTFSAAITDLTS